MNQRAANLHVELLSYRLNTPHAWRVAPFGLRVPPGPPQTWQEWPETGGGWALARDGHWRLWAKLGADGQPKPTRRQRRSLS